jgi:hypothetical protein
MYVCMYLAIMYKKKVESRVCRKIESEGWKVKEKKEGEKVNKKNKIRSA